MSALTTLCDPNGPSWPIVLSEGNTPLTLPDGTSLVINVAHAGPDTSPAQGGDHSQPRHVVSLRRDEQNKTGEEGYSAWVNPAAPRSRLFVTPPLPPYKGQTDEPDDNTLSARCKRWGVARLFLDGQGAQVTLRHLWTLEDALYVLWPAQEGFVFHICNGSPTQRRELVQGLYECGLAVPHPEAEDRADGPVLLPRSAFWQGAGPFARPPWISPLAASEPSTPQPVVPTPTFTPGNPRGSLHPTRPVKPSSDTPLYKRYCPPLKETLTFTPASASNGEHVKLCAKWHNSTRVNDGWRQQGSEEEHRAYLRKIEESPDSLGLIGAWNGEPWGYVEVYWVKASFTVLQFHNARWHH